MKGDQGRWTLVAFLVGAVLSSGNPIAVKFSNAELEPFWGATLRFALAAALMLTVMAVLRLRFPRGRALLGAVLYGIFNFGLAFACLFYALVELGAGFLQILLAVIPLITLLLVVVQRLERLRPAAVVGAMLALGGVLLMSQVALDASVSIGTILVAMGAAFCLAEGAVLVRIFPPEHPVTLNAVGMTVGAGVLLIASLLAGNRMVLPELQATWLALAYMVVIGTGVVFLLWVYVLEHWEASRAAYNFVLLPPITLFFSNLITGEDVGVEVVFGGLLILAGVYIGALRPTLPEPSDLAAPAPAPDPG
ncbi:MAG TPA: DMT family transporter [Acidimicrobiia bacterium]|nr:DMT family transporter [Acidimicrobiia bacterium]